MVNETVEVKDFKIYAVRNQEGKFFRSKGYGGYGQTWVDDINKAKTYTKIGQARSRVTFFANTYPAFGIPDIVEFTVTSGVVLDEGNRVKKAMNDKAKARLNQTINNAKRDIDKLQVKLGNAQHDKEKLAELTAKVELLSKNL